MPAGDKPSRLDTLEAQLHELAGRLAAIERQTPTDEQKMRAERDRVREIEMRAASVVDACFYRVRQRSQPESLAEILPRAVRALGQTNETSETR